MTPDRRTAPTKTNKGEGKPTPSDVLMADGYIDQAQEIKDSLCTLTGWVIARLRRKLT